MTLISVGKAHAPVLSVLHASGFDKPWSTEAFQDLLGTPGTAGLIATAPELDPMGFILWQSVVDQADIITVVTRPDCQGQGVGTGLVATMVDQLRQAGLTDIHLEVAADNSPALALYRAQGFETVGKRPGYYNRPQGKMDAVVMRLALTKD